jgi:hypothetical protein
MTRSFPPYYEDAARLLLTASCRGLVLGADANPDVAIRKLGAHIYRLLTQAPSHAQAAIDALEDLESAGLVICDPRHRARVLATIGTMLGNLQIKYRRISNK